MTLHDVALDDKFDLGKERIFLSGAQAVIRMLLMQRERDRLAGLNTAGFVSGYRGSPLGGLDLQLWKAKQQARAKPTSSSSQASTRSWRRPPAGARSRRSCSARASMTASSRSGTARVRASTAPATSSATPISPASSKHGGVLALMGDDHMAESSTNAHATEFLFVDTMIPILNPAGVQELIDYGLYGYALSRFAGTWTAIKCVKDNIESTASVDVSLDRLNIVMPEFDMPPGGLNIRHEIDHARPGRAAARVQARRRCRLHPRQRASTASSIPAGRTRRSASSPSARAISTCARRSTTSASTRPRANQLGVRLFKVGCPWPLDIEHIKDFARGLEMIIVVEEKRSLIEVQVREDLYGTVDAAAGRRQEGRARRLAVPGQGRARPQRHRDRDRRARAARHRPVGGDRRARRAHRQYQAMLADTKDIGAAHAVFLLRLPAQHLDQGAGRLDRRRRHRLPFHGAVDGPRHRRLHRDGRRGRAVGRPGAVLQARAYLPEPRRRHLQPFRHAGAALRARRPASTSPTRSSSTTPSR